MHKSIIKAGDKYNRLTAIKFNHRDDTYRQYWLFKCDCGNEKILSVNCVKMENNKSCGCLKKETTKNQGEKNKTHGMVNTKVYHSWESMKQRCLNKNDSGYRHYGNRGITICKEWLKFKNFYHDMGDRPRNKSLDRIKNNQGYCKENCKWSTSKEQANNRRTNRLLTHNGKTQNISQWAKELKLNPFLLYCRRRRGWSVKKTLTN